MTTPEPAADGPNPDGEVLSPGRTAQAAPLVAAMVEVARRLEALGLTEDPSGQDAPG